MGVLKIIDLLGHEESEKVQNALERLGYKVDELGTNLRTDPTLTDELNRSLGDSEGVLLLTDHEHFHKFGHLIYAILKAEKPILVIYTEAIVADDFNKLSRNRPGPDLVQLTNFDDLRPILEKLKDWNIQPGYSSFDEIVNTLVDGNEEHRIALVSRLRANELVDKQALSSRLRTEIKNKFSAERAFDFVTAIRDPRKLSSIRSWMLSALIWTDAENPENRKILTEHLFAQHEKDETVRYWTLAGLYLRDVSYLQDALYAAAQEEKGIIYMLARAIKNPYDSNLLSSFRRALSGKKYANQWQVLRILRIVAIPELIPIVVKIINTAPATESAAYDAMYALANVPNAKIAGPMLDEHPGAAETVSRLISILNGATPHAVRSFATILHFMNKEKVAAALTEARTNLSTRRTAVQLRNHLRMLEKETIQGVPVAGYAADTNNIAHDYLDIGGEVKVLTSVMLARDVDPPLAIGLFGGWGSGKSFFMRSMQAEIALISDKYKDDRASVFCTAVVQIEFNAWHYVDTDIYASLVSTIFEKLAEHILPSETSEEKQARFLSELSSNQAIIAEAGADKQKVQEAVSIKQAELSKLKTDRMEKEIQLKEYRIKDIKELLVNEDNKKELNDALTAMGIPTAISSLTALSGAVSEAYTVKGRLLALFFSLVNAKNKWLTLALIFLALIGVPFLGWLASRYLNVKEITANIGVVVLQASAFITLATTALRKAMKKVSDSLGSIEKLRGIIDKQLLEKRKTPTAEETALEKEINSMSAREAEIVSRLSLAAVKVAELEELIRSLKEDRSLKKFLSDRHGSDDYRKHLGLMSTIRLDFENLAKKLTENKTPAGSNPLDRIILYIDDLDRCPAEKVVDVLKAVHLLLAYPLFVVVVGVDPSWLKIALETKHADFLKSEQNQLKNEIWRPDSQRYLEKIFQVPFKLRPMADKGYRQLIENLLGQAEQRFTIPGTDKFDGQATDARQQGEQAQYPANNNQEGENSNADPAGNATETETKKEEKTTFINNEESLQIMPWEADFAAELAILFETPRSAKRFSNTYRILKASVHTDQLPAFEGSVDLPGNFQIPMLLLAMMIGSQAEARLLFPLFLRLANEGKGLTIILDSSGDEDNKKELEIMKLKLADITVRQWFPKDHNLVKLWLPYVRRFSFDVD